MRTNRSSRSGCDQLGEIGNTSPGARHASLSAAGPGSNLVVSAPDRPAYSEQRRHLGVIERVLDTYRYYLTRAGGAASAAGRRLTEHTIIPAVA
jgi:hypothetical protein